MPSVNIYYSNQDQEPHLFEAVDPLRDRLAVELSTPELALTRDEMSVRVLQSLGRGMLADIEMDIIATPFPGRVDRKNEICSDTRDFMLEQIPEAKDVRVWLLLQELGYSFDS